MKWGLVLVLAGSAFGQTATTTALTSSLNTYVTGTVISVQAIVSNNAATGTIVLKDGSTTLGSASVTTFKGPGTTGGGPMLTYAGANFSGISLATGYHSLTGVYSGDGTYGGSTSAVYGIAVAAVASSPQPISAMSLGPLAPLNGFLPNPNGWTRMRVDALPVDPNSAAIIAEMSPHKNYFHMDLGAPYGIPYNIVDSTTNLGLPVTLANNGEGPYIPDSDIFVNWPGTMCSVWVEGDNGANGCTTPTPINGDNHLLVLDRNKGVNFEGYRVVVNGTSITAVNTAAFDLLAPSVPQSPPLNFTRADTGGMSLFETLLTYDEAAAGPPAHALRMTTDQMGVDNYAFGDAYAVFHFPAIHQGSAAYHMQNNGFGYGSRLRLKTSFNCASMADTITQNVCITLQRYGLTIADGGSPLYITGTPDSRWASTHIFDLQTQISLSANMEIVEQTTPYASNRYPTGTPATISSFTASATSVTAGTPVTLTSTLANASYGILDGANAYLRNATNSTTLTPSVTTTYTLYSKSPNLNGDGSVSSQSITINVSGLPCFLLCGNLSANVIHN